MQRGRRTEKLDFLKMCEEKKDPENLRREKKRILNRLAHNQERPYSYVCIDFGLV